MRWGSAGGRRGRRTRRQPASLGEQVALAAVAGDAAGDDVLPLLAAAPRDGDHVVEGELGRREAVAAVLARVVVAGVDVRPGERHVGEGAFHTDVTEQAKHRGELHPDRHAPDLPVVDGDDLDLALEQQGDRFLPRDDPQWLVSGVQDERLVHRSDRKEIVPSPSEGCQGRPRSAQSAEDLGGRARLRGEVLSGAWHLRAVAPPGPGPGTLALDARRAPLHHALDLGEGRHGGVARRRHGERAVRRAAVHRPLRAPCRPGSRRSRPEAKESPPPTRSQISRPS